MMGKFKTSLDVKKISQTEWQLIDHLIYESDNIGIIIVPSGFVTNFGSVPRLPFVYLLLGGVGDEDVFCMTGFMPLLMSRFTDRESQQRGRLLIKFCAALQKNA